MSGTATAFSAVFDKLHRISRSIRRVRCGGCNRPLIPPSDWGVLVRGSGEYAARLVGDPVVNHYGPYPMCAACLPAHIDPPVYIRRRAGETLKEAMDRAGAPA